MSKHIDEIEAEIVKLERTLSSRLDVALIGEGVRHLLLITKKLLAHAKVLEDKLHG